MTAACVHKLSFAGLGKLSLVSRVLMGFSLASTIVSANVILGLHVEQRKREAGDRLTGFSLGPRC